MKPAQSLIDAVVEELSAHAPFDAMERAHLSWLAPRLELRYYAAGARVLARQSGVPTHIHIVQRGEIAGQRAVDKASVSESVVDQALQASVASLTEGEMFPIGAVIGERSTILDFVAARDTFCYRFLVADFEHLMDVSRPFRHFCTTRLSELIEQSRRNAQQAFAASVADTRRFSHPLGSLPQRPPISITADTSVADALRLMREKAVGSVLILDESARPVGIFTERDVVHRVALPGFDHSTAISSVMTPNPLCLPDSASLFEAAQVMTTNRFRHIIVMRENRAVAVVSERDLFSLQQVSTTAVSKRIMRADNADTLVDAARETRKVAKALIAQGVAPEQIMQLLTSMNDALVVRAIDIIAATTRLPTDRWCWLGLGSEGRMEQTLATDQDNALIFVAGGTADVESMRSRFLVFAAEVNRLLAECGFPLCKGDIMASNPRWCLSDEEWQTRFSAWMTDKSPDALLSAAIFFDFRALHGQRQLAHTLRTWLQGRAVTEALFLRLMAENALITSPPLSGFGSFVGGMAEAVGFAGVGESAPLFSTPEIDLKRVGIRPIVDAARVLSLSIGCAETNTEVRLRAVAHAEPSSSAEVDAIVHAFRFLQGLRLRNAIADPDACPQSEADATPTAAVRTVSSNQLRLADLDALDRRIVKEAFRQVSVLQSRVRLLFRL